MMANLRTISSLLFKYLLTTIALIVSVAIGASLSISPTPNNTETANDLSFILVALINALVFSYWLFRSSIKGWDLLLYFFLIYFGVNTFMTQIETWFFGDAVGFEGIQKWGIVQMGLISALLFSPLALLIWGKFRKNSNEIFNSFNRSIPIKQLLGLALLYVVVYFLFGYYIAWQSPEVRKFYTNSTTILPFLEHFRDLATTNFWIFPFQILRGLIWVGLGYIIVQILNKSRWENALIVALIFSMPATYLWIPNPYMPEAVRMAHFLETLSSNFIYGFVVGWLLKEK